MKITVLVVDDHFVVRNGLATTLEIEPDIQVIATAESGEDALRLYQFHRPDVVMMDLQLPGMGGIEATLDIRKFDPGAHILIFSTFSRAEEIRGALDAGASGYLQKSASREELVLAIRATAAGDRYLPSGLDDRISRHHLGPAITPRERQIIALIAGGSANKQIGHSLGIAEDTVKQHVSRILQKLAVNDRAQAAAEAIRRGIIRVG